MGYQFDILYKPEIDNKAGDGLSRMMQGLMLNYSMVLLALTVPKVLQLEDLYAEIEQDAEIQAIETQVLAGEVVKKGYVVVDGKVWYKRMLVISENSQFLELILKEYYDGVVGGHLGVLQTLK